MAVLVKYFNHSNVFLAKNVMEVLEHIKINDHAIALKKDQQLPFGPIYNLPSVKLKTLKTYIETNLTNNFIWPSKSSANVLIFFDLKVDTSLRCCVDYWGHNNFTIKDQYLLPLIDESLYWFGRTKRFIKIDLINAYHQIKICENDK